jgi:hypothetical protein
MPRTSARPASRPVRHRPSPNRAPEMIGLLVWAAVGLLSGFSGLTISTIVAVAGTKETWADRTLWVVSGIGLIIAFVLLARVEQIIREQRRQRPARRRPISRRVWRP